MIVFDGMLYVGTGWGVPGRVARIWAFDGTDWTQVNTDGFGDANNGGSRALAIYDGQLYAGTNDGGGAGGQVWRYDGPDPADWTQVATDGFGNGDYEVRVMESWDGQLYAGTAGNTAHPTVWAYNGTTWTDVTPTYPDVNNDSVRSMTVYKGALYVGVGNYSGSHPPGERGHTGLPLRWWCPEQVNLNGFDGDPINQACHSLCEFQGDLYAGVINVNWDPTPEVYGGAQVWRTNVPSTWYLAEGSTAGGMETYVLVQNPNPDPVTVDLTLMTDRAGDGSPELQNQTIPADPAAPSTGTPTSPTTTSPPGWRPPAARSSASGPCTADDRSLGPRLRRGDHARLHLVPGRGFHRRRHGDLRAGAEPQPRRRSP